MSSLAKLTPLLRGALVGATALLSAQVAGAGSPQEIFLEAEDGFELAASYFAADRPGPGILFLHQCDADREMWSLIASRLADAGVHSLTLDYRGYGGSTGAALPDFEAMSRAAQARIHASDIALALGTLAGFEEVDPNRLATGGSSCGGPRSISLAAEVGGVDAMLLLSTYLGKPALERFEASLRDVPILAVVSEGDGQTRRSLEAAFELSRSDESRLLVYKGGEHGYPLFVQDPDLQRVIARWFLRMLREPAQ